MSSDQSSQHPRRPHWGRWLLAVLVSLLLAPLFAPMLWLLMIGSGGGAGVIILGLLWTYIIAIPFSALGLLVLLAISLQTYHTVIKWHWAAWAALGAGIGFFILVWMVMPTAIDLTGLMFLSNGVLCGAAGAVIFRKVLLKGQKTAKSPQQV